MAKKLSLWMAFFQFMEQTFRLKTPSTIMTVPNRAEHIVEHAVGREISRDTIFDCIFKKRYLKEGLRIYKHARDDVRGGLIYALNNRYQNMMTEFIARYLKHLKSLYKNRGLGIVTEVHRGKIKTLAYLPYEVSAAYRMMRYLG